MDIICLLMLVNFQAKVNTDSNLYTQTVWTQVKLSLDHRRTPKVTEAWIYEYVNWVSL